MPTLTLPPRREFSQEYVLRFRNEHDEPIEVFYKDVNLNGLPPIRKHSSRNHPINYDALQTWINNLGEAIYNPLSAIFYPSTIDTLDGAHRTIILQTMDKPVRIVGLKLSKDRIPTENELKILRRHAAKCSRLDKVNPPTHFTEQPYSNRQEKAFLAARYYPPLSPIPDIYGDPPIERAIVKGLPLGWTMEEICKTIPKHKWRWNIPDMIQEDTDIRGKTILDVGCSIGYHSMILLDRGASHATLNTHDPRQIRKIKHLKAYRKYNVTILEGKIQARLAYLDDYDIIMVLNMFHHVLKQTPDSWWVFEHLLRKGKNVYMTMGTTWDVIKEYDNDVEKAFTSNMDCELTELGHTHYRGRKLYRVDER